jgi:hypothetical protein
VSLALSYLVGQMIGAALVAGFLALAKKWRWMPVPFILFTVIWGIGYLIAAN